MLTFLRGLRRRLRQRRASLTARAALLDRIGAPDAAPHAAWQQIFDRPEWREAPPGHRGFCGCCRRKVGKQDRVCPHCQAKWVPVAEGRDGRRTNLFAALSLLAALGIGVLAKFLAASLLAGYRQLPAEFIAFVETYLWVAGTILTLVLATYLYEILDIAPAGKWRPPAAAAQQERPDDDSEAGDSR
jgi:hypothetical protein